MAHRHSKVASRHREEPEYGFGDVVHALTVEHLDGLEWFPYARIYSYMALLAYGLIHPDQFLRWLDEKTGCTKTLGRAIRKDVHDQWFLDAEERFWHFAERARLFLYSPFRCPEDHSRRAFRRLGCPPLQPGWKMRCWSAKEPPREGTVRVKWYPSAEAVRRWPEGLGEIWTDLPLEPDGSLDLRPVLRLWGMENCYVLRVDGQRNPPDFGRRQTLDVSAIGVKVLLGEFHEVIGVVEQPTPPMRDARHARASVWLALSALPKTLVFAPYELLHALPLLEQVILRVVVAAPFFLREAFITILVLALLTIVQSMILLLEHILWPGLRMIGRFLLSAIVTVFVISARTGKMAWEWGVWGGRMACAWILACLEVIFLSEQDSKEWETRDAPGSNAHSGGIPDCARDLEEEAQYLRRVR
ncbi:hypothetical protein C8Q76DRAFT_709053 [Earliella scabrosa]|nr:hypothetical protein C8Q76DRAFT_709053 [Earliella scabrosa]